MPSAYCNDFSHQGHRCGAVVSQLQFDVFPAAATVDGDVDAGRRARRRAFEFVLVPVGSGDDDVEGARSDGEVHVLASEDVHMPGFGDFACVAVPQVVVHGEVGRSGACVRQRQGDLPGLRRGRNLRPVRERAGRTAAGFLDWGYSGRPGDSGASG